jgi:hypothetical protein
MAVIAGLAAVAAMYGWLLPARDKAAPERQAPPQIQAAPDHHTEETPHSARAPIRQTNMKAKVGTEPVNYKKSFAESKNYWGFAHDVLPAAKAGNADAQFYLSKVLEFCDYANRAHFTQKGAVLTLDQALQLAAKQNRPAEITQTIYDHS